MGSKATNLEWLTLRESVDARDSGRGWIWCTIHDASLEKAHTEGAKDLKDSTKY